VAARLSPVQQEFLKQLFGPCLGNVRKAAEAVCGTDDYTQFMTEEMSEAIKKRADQELVFNVPKAVATMQKILDDPDNTPYMDKLHKVAADILDRAGLSKVDRNVKGSTQIGLVLLPSLNPNPEQPPET